MSLLQYDSQNSWAHMVITSYEGTIVAYSWHKLMVAFVFFITDYSNCTFCVADQIASSKWVANPSLSHSSVQSRAPMAKPNQAWAISWHSRVPQRLLSPDNVLCDRKMICGLQNMNEGESTLQSCVYSNTYTLSVLSACYYYMHAMPWQLAQTFLGIRLHFIVFCLGYQVNILPSVCFTKCLLPVITNPNQRFVFFKLQGRFLSVEAFILKQRLGVNVVHRYS